MTVVNAENYYQEHFFKGTHRNLKELPGFGGDDGKAIVFADQYPGANMGAKIQAAITDLGATGGKIIVVPGAHVGTAAVTTASNITIEFIRGATYTANGNFEAFIVPANATNWGFVNPYLIGANNAAHTNNKGISLSLNSGKGHINGGYISQFYGGIMGSHVNSGPVFIDGCFVTNCKASGIYVLCGGTGTWVGASMISNCIVNACGTHGFNVYTAVQMNNCLAYGHTYNYYIQGYYVKGSYSNLLAITGTNGFIWYGNASVSGHGLEFNNCKAISLTGTGFYAVPYATSAGHDDVVYNGCWAVDCASAGFSNLDNASYNLHVVMNGCITRCLATQAYAVKFYRSLKSLVMTGNDLSGYSTAAEYWHPALNKGDYEIGHNIVG